MNGTVLAEKSSFKMLGLTFFSKLDWRSYIIPIAKFSSKKFGVLIHSMKSFSPVASLRLYKSTIQPCMELCCHVWAGAPSCFLEFLNTLQNRICKTVGPSFNASLEPLAHCSNAASLHLFTGINFIDVHLNLVSWFYFLILKGGLFIILTDCMIFLSPFLDVTRMSMSTVSFYAQVDSWILCL